MIVICGIYIFLLTENRCHYADIKNVSGVYSHVFGRITERIILSDEGKYEHSLLKNCVILQTECGYYFVNGQEVSLNKFTVYVDYRNARDGSGLSPSNSIDS